MWLLLLLLFSSFFYFDLFVSCLFVCLFVCFSFRFDLFSHSLLKRPGNLINRDFAIFAFD